MEIPSNLISDSPLLQDTFDFVVANGGRVRMSDVAEAIFSLSHASDELAAALVSDLISNDVRFVTSENDLIVKDYNVEALPFDEVDFIVLDVEACAPKALPARIIELAAYRVRAGQITGEFQALVNPGVALSRFITQLTGLSNEMIAVAPTFAELATEWLIFAGDAVLVAHNSDFDVPLLNQEIGRVFPGRRMRNAEVCTVKLARRVIHNSGGHNLDALAEHFGFEIPERHRAASDARATVRVFLHLIDELKKHDVATLSEARDFRLPARHAARHDTQLTLDV